MPNGLNPGLDNPDFFGYVDTAFQVLCVPTQYTGVPICFMKSARVTYGVILAGAAIWCFGFVIPPVLLDAGGVWSDVANLMYPAFHRICHQLDGRSFHLLGHQLAVCERCASIYVAFLAGVLCYPLSGTRIRSMLLNRTILLFSLAPMVADVVLDMSGLYASSVITRMFTGMLFGIVVPFTIIPVAQAGVHELLTSRELSSPSLKKGPLHA